MAFWGTVNWSPGQVPNGTLLGADLSSPDGNEGTARIFGVL
jgi:hypothetical protein